MSTTSCCTRALVSVASRLPMPPALETDCKEIGTRGLAMPWQSEARHLGGVVGFKTAFFDDAEAQASRQHPCPPCRRHRQILRLQLFPAPVSVAYPG